jgi:hypothetical protein
MTDREVELILGHRLGAQIVFVVAGGRAFHKDAPDDWYEYPPDPKPPRPGPPDNGGERMAA